MTERRVTRAVTRRMNEEDMRMARLDLTNAALTIVYDHTIRPLREVLFTAYRRAYQQMLVFNRPLANLRALVNSGFYPGRVLAWRAANAETRYQFYEQRRLAAFRSYRDANRAQMDLKTHLEDAGWWDTS